MLEALHYYIILLIRTEKKSTCPQAQAITIFNTTFFFSVVENSMISAQGVVVATAMAVSGTVILLALRLHKSFPPPPILRPCISSAGKKSKKKKKRVHFAEDVVESCRDGQEFRKSINSFKSKKEPKIRGIPENRVALYNGILRDRVAQRLAYSC